MQELYNTKDKTITRSILDHGFLAFLKKLEKRPEIFEQNKHIFRKKSNELTKLTAEYDMQKDDFYIVLKGSKEKYSVYPKELYRTKKQDYEACLALGCIKLFENEKHKNLFIKLMEDGIIKKTASAASSSSSTSISSSSLNSSRTFSSSSSSFISGRSK